MLIESAMCMMPIYITVSTATAMITHRLISGAGMSVAVTQACHSLGCPAGPVPSAHSQSP